MFKHHTRILAIFLVGFCSLSPAAFVAAFYHFAGKKTCGVEGKKQYIVWAGGRGKGKKVRSEQRKWNEREREQKLPGICCCEWAKSALHMLGRKGLGSTLNFSLLQSCRRFYARGTFPRCTWLVTCEISLKIDPICVVRSERWKTNKSWAAAAKKRREKSVQNSDNNEIIDGLRAHGKVILVITRKKGQRIAEDIELWRKSCLILDNRSTRCRRILKLLREEGKESKIFYWDNQCV